MKRMSSTISCRICWTFWIWKWIWSVRWNTSHRWNMLRRCVAYNHGRWAENSCTIVSMVFCSMSPFVQFSPLFLCKYCMFFRYFYDFKVQHFLIFLLHFPFSMDRIADWNNVYGDGTFDYKVVYPYVATINTISQSVAMYCLVLFYRATRVSRC